MFKRTIFDTWEGLIPLLGLLLTLFAFSAIVIRALRMKADERKHLSNLPLETEDNSPQH